ncbi:S26 family signal peptidase [Streptomyces sp. SID13031]|uniref:S26 family signal peptidase n=1 Tax=Streptomyces sp. SID13031 TaxID=2706046 RepID=UPI0019409906|nr:S26 family signal peptidase [Streptomyces sp. SID13031]
MSPWRLGTVVALAAVVLAVRRRYVSVRVVGTSMSPTLQAGERILVRRAGPDQLQRGQIIVVAHPSAIPGDPEWLVKRLVALPGDPVPRDEVAALRDAPDDVVPAGRLVLLGDNPTASFDSRTTGYFQTHSLLGIAVGWALF